MTPLFEQPLKANPIIKYSKFIIYGLLLLVVVLVTANNWNARYYGDIAAWYAVLPAALVLLLGNAIKIWAAKGFRAKIAFYVLDVLALLVLTVFTDGTLISMLYILILTEFYLEQERLAGSIAMAASCAGLLLVSFGVSNYLRGIGVNVVSIVTSMFGDLVLIVLHFFIINFAIQMYRKNLEITKAMEELDSSNAKLREAYRELQEITALEERQRIAKDIHDTAGHSITTVIMQTEAAKLVIDSDPEDAKRKLIAANLQAKHALEEIRESVHLLSGNHGKKTLKDSLLEIIHDSTDGTEIAVRYDIDEFELCDAKRRFLLNTLKEGISNGLRHGGATAFWVEIKKEGDRVRFLLSDNGSGMNISELKEGFGLRGMHDRAASLGGEVWFETEEDEGFEIHLELPADEKGA